MRLYVDGELLLDGWGEQRDADRLVDFSFEAGRRYALRIEFTNNQRAAWVIFGFHPGYEDFSRAVVLARQAEGLQMESTFFVQ